MSSKLMRVQLVIVTNPVMHVAQVKWTAKVRERSINPICDDPMYSGRVSTMVLNGSSVEGTYKKANRPKHQQFDNPTGPRDRSTGDGVRYGEVR